MKKKPYIKKQLHELLYHALETERGGLKICETALSCARNEDLKGEWEEYLEQTHTHEDVLLTAFTESGLDPETATPGRKVVEHTGESLVSDVFEEVQTTLNEAEITARESVDEAREAAAYGAMWIFISLLIGAFVASLMAVFGGRQRDSRESQLY